jgi:hypothetical protein
VQGGDGMKRFGIALALLLAFVVVMAYAEAAPFGPDGISWPHRASVKACQFGWHWSTFYRKCVLTALPADDES